MECVVVKLFKALADKNRLRIIKALQSFDELYTCQIVELLDVSGATTSKHLSILSGENLISSRKEGRWIIYQTNPSHPQINQITEILNTEDSDRQTYQSDEKKMKEILGITAEDLCRKQRGDRCCP